MTFFPTTSYCTLLLLLLAFLAPPSSASHQQQDVSPLPAQASTHLRRRRATIEQHCRLEMDVSCTVAAEDGQQQQQQQVSCESFRPAPLTVNTTCTTDSLVSIELLMNGGVCRADDAAQCVDHNTDAWPVSTDQDEPDVYVVVSDDGGAYVSLGSEFLVPPTYTQIQIYTDATRQLLLQTVQAPTAPPCATGDAANELYTRTGAVQLVGYRRSDGSRVTGFVFRPPPQVQLHVTLTSPQGGARLDVLEILTSLSVGTFVQLTNAHDTSLLANVANQVTVPVPASAVNWEEHTFHTVFVRATAANGACRGWSFARVSTGPRPVESLA